MQPTTTFGLTQVVVYNPRDEHGFASHDMDYLRPDGPGRPRGWFASEDTGHPHWKAFFFD